jgi:hypothetical protein
MHLYNMTGIEGVARDWRSTSGHKRTSGVVRLMFAFPQK